MDTIIDSIGLVSSILIAVMFVPQIEIGDVGSLDIGIIVHFYSLLEVFRFYMILKFSSNLNFSSIRTIYDFDGNVFFVTFEKPVLPLLLIFHCEEKTFIVILTTTVSSA